MTSKLVHLAATARWSDRIPNEKGLVIHAIAGVSRRALTTCCVLAFTLAVVAGAGAAQAMTASYSATVTSTPGSASAAQVFQLHGLTAFALFWTNDPSDPTGCRMLESQVGIGSDVARTVPQQPAGSPLAFARVGSWNSCTGELYHDYWAVNEVSSSDFSIDAASLQSARLKTVLTGTVDFATGASGPDLRLDLTWSASGASDLLRSISVGDAGMGVHFHALGRSATAQARGSVSDGVTEFAPQTSANAQISSFKYGYVVVDAAPSELAATTTAASSYDYESIYATFDSPPGTGCVVSSALVLGSSQTNTTPRTELRVLSQQYDLCADQLISNSDVYGGVTDSNLSVAPNARSAVLYGTVAGTDLVSGSAATATVDLTGQANDDPIRSGSTNLSVSRGLVTLDHVGNVFARADYAGSVAVAPGPSFEGSATYGYIDRFRWLHH